MSKGWEKYTLFDIRDSPLVLNISEEMSHIYFFQNRRQNDRQKGYGACLENFDFINNLKKLFGKLLIHIYIYLNTEK